MMRAHRFGVVFKAIFQVNITSKYHELLNSPCRSYKPPRRMSYSN